MQSPFLPQDPYAAAYSGGYPPATAHGGYGLPPPQQQPMMGGYPQQPPMMMAPSPYDASYGAPAYGAAPYGAPPPTGGYPPMSYPGTAPTDPYAAPQGYSGGYPPAVDHGPGFGGAYQPQAVACGGEGDCGDGDRGFGKMGKGFKKGSKKIGKGFKKGGKKIGKGFKKW